MSRTFEKIRHEKIPGLQRYVQELQDDERFRTVRDRERPPGFNDISYWRYTELEARNVTVIYGTEYLGEEIMMDEVSVKERHGKKRCIISNSPYMKEAPMRGRNFNLEQLRNLVEELC